MSKQEKRLEIKEVLPGPFNLGGQSTELVEFTEGIHVFHGKRRSNLEDDLCYQANNQICDR